MQNITIKNYIFILVGMSALFWFALAFFYDLDLSKAQDFFSLVPKVVIIDLLIIGYFVKWGWKLKFFKGWLVPFPDINGTWMGNIFSDWINPETGGKPNPIPVMLTINQSFFHVSCVMHTGEMKSYSYSEGFTIDVDRQLKQLSYSYTSKPRASLSERSSMHDGTAVFQIVEKPNRKLEGRYWTERMTKGEIILDFHSKEILEEIPESTAKHPVTEEQNRR